MTYDKDREDLRELLLHWHYEDIDRVDDARRVEAQNERDRYFYSRLGRPPRSVKRTKEGWRTAFERRRKIARRQIVENKYVDDELRADLLALLDKVQVDSPDAEARLRQLCKYTRWMEKHSRIADIWIGFQSLESAFEMYDDPS